MHKDSLGYEQPIKPGEVNWMVSAELLERTAPIGGSLGNTFTAFKAAALPRCGKTDPL